MTAKGLRHRLKRETMDVHLRLHDHGYFAAMAAGTISTTDFQRLMRRMGSFYAALDPLMAAACAKTGAGVYHYRHRGPMFGDIEDPGPGLLAIDDLAALTGAAYVVDGSVMGAQLLRRAILGRLQHPYWDWCAAHGAAIWHETRALIAFAESCDVNQDRTVQFANAVFAAFEDHMQMAGREVAE